MVAGSDAFQQRGQGHGAVVHAALVGDVADDLDLLRLGMGEQLCAAPGARAGGQFYI
ncbi:hypothetical protein D3C78_1959060 [compost metagenome]